MIVRDVRAPRRRFSEASLAPWVDEPSEHVLRSIALRREPDAVDQRREAPGPVLAEGYRRLLRYHRMQKSTSIIVKAGRGTIHESPLRFDFDSRSILVRHI